MISVYLFSYFREENITCSAEEDLTGSWFDSVKDYSVPEYEDIQKWLTKKDIGLRWKSALAKSPVKLIS